MACTPAAYQRNTFAAHVSLARSTLAAGEVEEAVTAGQQALDLLSRVHSRRWADHLDTFTNDLTARAPGYSPAEDFLTRYRELACPPKS